MGLLTIKYEDFSNYKKTLAKFMMIYREYVSSTGEPVGYITDIKVIRDRLLVKSTYNYYPNGHDSRSIMPQKIVQEVEIDLGKYIDYGE